MNALNLLIALGLLQLVDIYTSYIVIEKQGGRELNPIMNQLFHVFGTLPTLVVFKSLVMVLAWKWLTPYPWVLVALVVLYCGIVINNVRQVK